MWKLHLLDSRSRRPPGALGLVEHGDAGQTQTLVCVQRHVAVRLAAVAHRAGEGDLHTLHDPAVVRVAWRDLLLVLHVIDGGLADRPPAVVHDDVAVPRAHSDDAEGVTGRTRVRVEVVGVISVERRALERQPLAVAHADRLQELRRAAKQVVVRAETAHLVRESGHDVLLDVRP